MWEHLNEMLHTKGGTTLAVSIRSTFHAEIKYYHSPSHLLRFDDRRHLCEQESLTKLLDGLLATQCRWLRMVIKPSDISSKDVITQTTMTSFSAKKSYVEWESLERELAALPPARGTHCALPGPNGDKNSLISSSFI